MAEQTTGDTLPAAGEAAARPPLTYGRIIHTAIALIEREGAQALSMRRVGAELGVAAMSLYNHVAGKEAILDGVADAILAGLETEADPGADWRDRIRALAHAFRRAAQEHPRCMSVVLSRTMDWTRSLPVIETMLTIGEQAGFERRTAVRLMRAFMAYVLGTLMREEGTARALRQVTLDRDRIGDLVDPARFPHVVRASRELMHPDFDGEFAFGLELLIGAMERLPRDAC